MVKLKHLVENSTEKSYNSLSTDEKKALYETMKSFNLFRESLKSNKLYEAVTKIAESIDLAERYTISESDDWMESKMIQTDMKEMKKMSEGMLKEVEKVKEIEKQLHLMYEQIGMKLERYFHIDDIV